MGRTPDSPDFRARLTPPKTLDDRAATVWRHTVQAVQRDHFAKSDLPLLAAYCHAAVQADEAAQRLRDEGQVVAGKTNPWLSVQALAVKSLVALSARLRLCPQSRYDRLKAGTSARQGIPTYDDDDGLLAGPERRPLRGLASFR